jgi:hypothetical protein
MEDAFWFNSFAHIITSRSAIGPDQSNELKAALMINQHETLG